MTIRQKLASTLRSWFTSRAFLNCAIVWFGLCTAFFTLNGFTFGVLALKPHVFHGEVHLVQDRQPKFNDQVVYHGTVYRVGMIDGPRLGLMSTTVDLTELPGFKLRQSDFVNTEDIDGVMDPNPAPFYVRFLSSDKVAAFIFLMDIPMIGGVIYERYRRAQSKRSEPSRTWVSGVPVAWDHSGEVVHVWKPGELQSAGETSTVQRLADSGDDH